ncbi:Hypothetical predicted protein [Octopus vulgaris]|uniref:Uncharacterized protein n=1 Tax=Octopus vulgaris TaxID=6645 RepID=A0AA36B825_OCTVU|nr:Hypothetical predicted protein [Octopus vulgaris]
MRKNNTEIEKTIEKWRKEDMLMVNGRGESDDGSHTKMSEESSENREEDKARKRCGILIHLVFLDTSLLI